MPRRKYNPDGANDYSSPKEKPPRYDLRRKHKIKDDPLDKKDDLNEEKLMKNSDKEFELAKKIAKNKIRTAGEIKHIKDHSGFDIARQGIEGFSFKEKGMKSVATTYKHLANAFLHMVKASNIFAKCKSSQVSPDGKLGGKGYVQPIKSIRASMAETINVMSELLDTFYDEVNSPYWKKQTFEENPMVKKILEDADKLVDKAEDIEEETLKKEDIKEDQEKNIPEKENSILEEKTETTVPKEEIEEEEEEEEEVEEKQPEEEKTKEE